MSIDSEYINNIWAQGYAFLAWFNSQGFSQTNTPFQLGLLQQSLLNASDTIGAANFVLSINNQISDLQTILALPINFGSVSAIINNRLLSLQTISSGLQGIMPSLPLLPASDYLNSGTPGIPTSDYISYFSSFSGETNSSYEASGILANVSGWITASNILASFYGPNPTRVLDTLQTITSSSLEISSVLYPFASGFSSSSLSMQYIYNQAYVMPSIFLAANVSSLSMGYLLNQQSIIARNSFLSMASNFQEVLLAAQNPIGPVTPQVTIVMGGETLQDIAARTLGNFELWEQIAQLNNILPGTNLTPGTQLFLPPVSSTNQTALNYSINVLGRDLNIGPTNSIMPPWGGDFQTILGSNNLIYALGRRIQTTLGDFVFHQNYGSRIPPEIGSVQTIQTAGQIAAFGKSCLLSDPRVASVSNVSISSGQTPGTIFFQATVIPVGPNQTPVQVNEVLRPA